MRERNEVIYKLLTLAGVVLLAPGVLLSVLLGDTADQRIWQPLLMAVIYGVMAVVLWFSKKNPNMSRQYKISIVKSKLRSVRRIYAPDPQGLRNISYGIAMLLTAVLADVVLIGSIFYTDLPLWLQITLILIVLSMVVTVEIVERKLDKNNKS